MKVRDLLKDCISEMWITAEEGPDQQPPDIKIHCCSDCEDSDFLSEKVLDSEVCLIKAVGEAIYISLNW